MQGKVLGTHEPDGIHSVGTPRAPLLLMALTAAISTIIFNAEPRARREILVVYTWWRVAEAACGKWLGLSIVQNLGRDHGKESVAAEQAFAAVLIGAAALLVQGSSTSVIP